MDIDSDFEVPPEFEHLVKYYNDCQHYVKIHFLRVADSHPVLPKTDQGVVHLLSGGKDSTFKLVEMQQHVTSSRIMCLYVAGTTINAEFLRELPVVRRICKQLGVRLKVTYTWDADYSNAGLMVKLRASWRDMLLFGVARSFGSHISTGISYDQPYWSSTSALLEWPGSSLNFSESKLVRDTFQRLLNCKIERARSESSVYRKMKRDMPSLLKMTNSCANPLGRCNLETDWNHACRKCRTLSVYDKIDAGMKLVPRDIEFVLSNEYLGDSVLLRSVKKMITHSRSSNVAKHS
jgi:hypothetical protein